MNREEICNKQFKELFGVDRNPSSTDPEFMDILQKFIFGEISQVGNLDNKMRELITITVLSTMQTLPQLKSHVNACLNVGISPIEIRETIYQIAPFIGFPKTLNAIDIMNEVFKEKNIQLPLRKVGTTTDEDRYQKGLKIQEPIYGTEIKDKYSSLPSNYGDKIAEFLTANCFGDYYTRGSLDIKTRELLVICILTTLGMTAPLKSHVYGNIKVGNSIEDIYAALIQCLPYVGFPLTFLAINSIKDLNIKIV